MVLASKSRLGRLGGLAERDRRLRRNREEEDEGGDGIVDYWQSGDPARLIWSSVAVLRCHSVSVYLPPPKPKFAISFLGREGALCIWGGRGGFSYQITRAVGPLGLFHLQRPAITVSLFVGQPLKVLTDTDAAFSSRSLLVGTISLGVTFISRSAGHDINISPNAPSGWAAPPHRHHLKWPLAVGAAIIILQLRFEGMPRTGDDKISIHKIAGLCAASFTVTRTALATEIFHHLGSAAVLHTAHEKSLGRVPLVMSLPRRFLQ